MIKIKIWKFFPSLPRFASCCYNPNLTPSVSPGFQKIKMAEKLHLPQILLFGIWGRPGGGLRQRNNSQLSIHNSQFTSNFGFFGGTHPAGGWPEIDGLPKFIKFSSRQVCPIQKPPAGLCDNSPRCTAQWCNVARTLSVQSAKSLTIQYSQFSIHNYQFFPSLPRHVKFL